MELDTITKLVKASGVKPGELILIHFWGEGEDAKTANHFMTAVSSLGASPVLLQQSRSVNRDIFSAAAESAFDDRYYELFSHFDAVIDVFAYQPVVLGYEIAPDHMELYRQYMSQLFYKLLQCKRFTQIRLPTPANALESGLEPDDFIQRMNMAYNIDYDALSAACTAKVQELQDASGALLHTGQGCTLEFDLSGRTWLIDAGDGDLPCGEVYIAPVEGATQGSVFFDTFYMDGVKYSNVTLYVSNGEVTGSSNDQITKLFSEMPKENRIICELGIGMNPNVTDQCGYTVLDEKMCGTFHVAVGSNDMFGGENHADDHIDFVGHGKIEVI